MPNTNESDSFKKLGDESSNAKGTELLMAVDIGNSTVVVGLFDGPRLVRRMLFASQKGGSYRDYGILLRLELAQMADVFIRNMVICSVVPELTGEWKQLASEEYQASVYEVNALSDLGLSFKVDDPSFIGPDLIANAFAAWKMFNHHCIIIDLGTATTLQVVSREGRFEGGIIVPGLELSLKSLGQGASLLKSIELERPTELIGTNTRESILSGVVNGHVYMLKGFVQELQDDYPNAKVLLTGGLAASIKDLLDAGFVHDPDLTLQGLYLAFQELKTKGL